MEICTDIIIVIGTIVPYTVFVETLLYVFWE